MAMIHINDDAVAPPPQAPAVLAWPGGDRLAGQHVLILGLGLSGLAMARWCARLGAQVTVADTREAPAQLPALQREVPEAIFVTGPLTARLVEGAELSAVYKSPGLTPLEVAPVFDCARSMGLTA